MPIHCQTKFTKQLPVYLPSDWSASPCMVYLLGSEGITGRHQIIVDYSSNVCERVTCTQMIPLHKEDNEMTSENNLESCDE